MGFVNFIVAFFVLALVFCVYMFICSLRNTKNQNQNIDNNPALAEEKSLKEYLENYSTWNQVTRKSRRNFACGNDYYETFEKNGKAFASIINNGAKLVFIGGARPDATDQETHVFAMTPKMVFHKNGTKLAAQIAKSAYLLVHKYEAKNYGKKDVSVVGGAIAGGVIAGGAGAVVGAINASNKNANGGKTVVTDVNKRCQIQFMGEFVDCIIISKELVDKYGAPTTVKYEPVITNEYYMFYGIYDGGMSEHEWQKSLVDYVWNLILELRK